MTESIFNSIRILPREDLFLTRNVGNSGQVFFNKDTKTLQVYDGTATGGYELASENNLIKLISQKGIASYTYTVTVAGPQGSDTGNKYILNGVYKPALTLLRGYTYVFNQSDPTNLYFPNPTGGAFNQHPISFSSDDPNGDLTDDGTVYGADVLYLLDNVQVTRSQYISRFRLARSRHVIITARETTPDTLYYYCSVHANMGNTITVSDPGTGSGSGSDGASIEVSDTAPTSPSTGNLWLNTTNGILYVYQQGVWIQPSYEIPSTFTEITTSDSTTITPTGLDRLNFREGSNIEITTDTQTNTITFSVVGVTGGGTPGVDLTAFSIGPDATPDSAGGILYDNTTGVFTFIPPDLSSYQTSSALTSDIDAHLNTSTATTSQILSWTGSDYDWIDRNTLTSNLTFNDNVSAVFGTGSDAEIYFDGFTHYFDNFSTSPDTQIRVGAGGYITMKSGTNNMIQLNGDTTGVTLYHSSSPKIATTATGVSVTGDLTLGGDIITQGSGTPELVSDNEILLTATTSITITAPTGIIVSGITTLEATTEVTSPLSGATGTVTHDLNNGSVFYHTSPSANFTANFTNVPTTTDRVIDVEVVVEQGLTAYMPTAIQIDGTTRFPFWEGGTGAPSGTVNGIDIITFRLFRTTAGNWRVTAKAVGYLD